MSPRFVIAFSATCFRKIIRAHVAQGQKAVLLAAVVYKGGLQAPFHLLNYTQVNIPRDGLLKRHLDVEFNEFTVFQNGHPLLFRVDGIDEHLLFHNSLIKVGGRPRVGNNGQRLF